MIDLHSHSTASDGQYTPSELVMKAASESVSVLALTDHDTVSGNSEAQAAAKKNGIFFIPGIEIQIQWPTGEFHLLGLGLTHTSESLKNIVADLQNGRRERNLCMIQKMQESGIPVTIEEIEMQYKNKTIGRPHFADYLVQHKIVKNRQQAFDKYLAKGRPWYVSRVGADLEQAVKAVVDSGGVPVIAHPLSLYVSWGKIESVLTEIHERGVQGLEAWHPGIRVVEAQRLEDLARRLGFFITAGSDFHGEKIRSDRRLGHSAGGRIIEDLYWTQELQPHLQFAQ
mgnify:CR=1 FL=1